MIEEVLATARLTRLVTEDSITQPFRYRIGHRDTLLNELVHCRMCMSVWAALAVIVLRRVKVMRWVISVLALSEGAILLQEFVDGD